MSSSLRGLEHITHVIIIVNHFRSHAIYNTYIIMKQDLFNVIISIFVGHVFTAYKYSRVAILKSMMAVINISSASI